MKTIFLSTPAFILWIAIFLASSMAGVVDLGSPPTTREPHVSPGPVYTEKIPSPEEEKTLLDRFVGHVAETITTPWHDSLFVWLPAIERDPNTRLRIGVLPVLLLTNKENHQIRHILAPGYTYNSLFGQTGEMNYYFFPTDASQLIAIASVSEHTNRDSELSYQNTS